MGDHSTSSRSDSRRLVGGVVLELALHEQDRAVLDDVARVRVGPREARDAHRAREILEAEAAHLGARHLPRLHHQLGLLEHEPRDPDLAAPVLRELVEVPDGAGAQQGDEAGALLERVPGEVEAEDLVLQGEHLGLGQACRWSMPSFLGASGALPRRRRRRRTWTTVPSGDPWRASLASLMAESRAARSAPRLCPSSSNAPALMTASHAILPPRADRRR